VEVDGVLPGDDLLLPRRCSLLLRHLLSSALLRGGDSARGCSVPAAREENPTSDGGAFYMSGTQSDGPRGPLKGLWAVGWRSSWLVGHDYTRAEWLVGCVQLRHAGPRALLYKKRQLTHGRSQSSTCTKLPVSFSLRHEDPPAAICMVSG
jgi:hypothetical protein